MPSRANHQLASHQYGRKVELIFYNPDDTNKYPQLDLKNDEVAVVHVKLRLCMWLRRRKNFGRRRITRNDKGESYIDTQCLLLGRDWWRRF